MKILTFIAQNQSIVESASKFEITEIINKFLAYAIIVAGLLSVVFIFVGGISFILSGGQEDKIKQAVGTIRYSIIGLVVTVLAIVIVNVVGNALGLDVVKYINYNDIIETVTNLGGTANPDSLD